jgi:hypothetical protein
VLMEFNKGDARAEKSGQPRAKPSPGLLSEDISSRGRKRKKPRNNRPLVQNRQKQNRLDLSISDTGTTPMLIGKYFQKLKSLFDPSTSPP